jgi:deoxyribodipyrimidine photo-lyase
VDRRWFGSLRSFHARLRWHCHFMQKLEDEPRVEFENFSRAYDGLREPFFDTAEARQRFAAWQAGRTGYPMVDAVMRCLHATGWVNFRMRAMLVSFASHHLWLHWRPTAVWLARHFLDFEPGIHFSQFQMQSGVTGINTVRIYSPAKQALDQDPTGEFVRRWVPELADVPVSYLAEPHRMPLATQGRAGCLIGRDYPRPLVDHATAYREARERIAAVRRQAEARADARRVYLKHGSRKRAGRGAVRPEFRERDLLPLLRSDPGGAEQLGLL